MLRLVWFGFGCISDGKMKLRAMKMKVKSKKMKKKSDGIKEKKENGEQKINLLNV